MRPNNLLPTDRIRRRAANRPTAYGANTCDGMAAKGTTLFELLWRFTQLLLIASPCSWSSFPFRYHDDKDAKWPVIHHSKAKFLLQNLTAPVAAIAHGHGMTNSTDKKWSGIAIGTEDGDLWFLWTTVQQQEHQEQEGASDGDAVVETMHLLDGQKINNARIRLLQLLDIDLDCHPDIVICVESSGSIPARIIFLFNEDGNFLKATPVVQRLPEGEECVDWQFADLEQNGCQKLILSTSTNQYPVRTGPNKSDTTDMTKEEYYRTFYNATSDTVTSDAHHHVRSRTDGNVDPAFPPPLPESPKGVFRILRQKDGNNKRGEFKYAMSQKPTWSPMKVLVHDLNQDGWLDIVMAPTCAQKQGGFVYCLRALPNSTDFAMDSVEVSDLLYHDTFSLAVLDKFPSSPYLVSTGRSRLSLHNIFGISFQSNKEYQIPSTLHIFLGIDDESKWGQVQAANIRGWKSDDELEQQFPSILFLIAGSNIINAVDWGPGQPFRLNQSPWNVVALKQFLSFDEPVGTFGVLDFDMDGYLDVVVATKESRTVLIVYGEPRSVTSVVEQEL